MSMCLSKKKKKVTGSMRERKSSCRVYSSQLLFVIMSLLVSVCVVFSVCSTYLTYECEGESYFRSCSLAFTGAASTRINHFVTNIL